MGCDVTIRGAGVLGLACAWALTRRGLRVQVIDRSGVGAGASGGVVGALAPHVPEAWTGKKAFQLAALLAAPAFWAGVAEAGGLDPGYARLGRLMPIADDAALARAHSRAQEAQSLWQGQAEWRVITTDAAGPWAPHSASGWLVQDTLSARIAPLAACRALAAAIRAAGGVITTDPAAPDLPRPGDGPTIWATGAAGLWALSQDLGRTVGVPVKGQAAVLGLDRRDMPQVQPEGLHIVPHADGTVAVGSTTERSFETPDSTDALLDDVITRARAAVPALADAPVLHRWAGLRPRARSRAPMLGPWPGRPGQFVANGGFKIGLGIAPEVARCLADVITANGTVPDGLRVEDSL